MLALVLWFLASAPDDSIPLAQARASLSQGDTLAAMETLHDWSATHIAGQELNDLLGKLHLPDEPLDSASAAPIATVANKPGRDWRLRVDGAALSANALAWGFGTTILTRVGEVPILGAQTSIDAGLATMLWSVGDSTLAWGVDPLVGLSLAKGAWDFRLDVWSGALDSRWEAGGMATVSRTTSDSSGYRRRFGAMLRASRLATTFAGGFCQWDKVKGIWLWETRADIRLRRDPVDDASKVADSLRPVIRGTRLQGICKGLFMRRWGNFGIGPALEVDARTSLESDSWVDEKGRRQELRQDCSITSGAIARFVSSGGRWGEARLGWISSLLESDIDPDFSKRNSGLVSSISLGLSF